MLVADGVMDIKTMKQARITRERLFSALRGKGIKQLGEVKRLYMEAAGEFTCIREEQPTPGLSVLPDWDTDFLQTQTVYKETVVCCGCGYTAARKEPTCSHCGSDEWTSAVAA
jgi:uncharacterized membrane protein YcaP (DUF421 family)